jgi:(2Fe-2S) ferredoxin
MPPPFERHVFVCTNRRPDGAPKGCCASKGGDELRLALKNAADQAGVRGVRINSAGCLDACERGMSVVVYPEGVWYGPVKLEDVKDLVQSQLVEGVPLERLRMAPIEPRKKEKGKSQ